MPLSQLAAAIAFYTVLPVPQRWMGDFQQVARWVVVVGVLLGGLLAGLDWGLGWLGMPLLTRSAVVVAAWVAVTGGLHLDGAMDTADGLAVQDPTRRLAVMADSATGAFGAIAAALILVIKTCALSDLTPDRWLIFITVLGWARWGQLVAIARYPYLKPTGKGAFHKQAVRSLRNTLPSFCLLVMLSATPLLLHMLHNQSWWLGVPLALGLSLGGGAIAWLTGVWFNRQLGGHTGDTYGAVVEWTETLLLTSLTLVT